jgi:ASC-1-like (ASCH) protein
MPAFLTKRQVYDWIRSGEKTIELRSGKSVKGDTITFLNGRCQTVKARILRKREGRLEDLVNTVTYRKIVPTAKSLDEAMAFVMGIYPLAEGTFTTYEFQLSKEV